MFSDAEGPPQPNLAGTAFHSQHDGARCELVDLLRDFHGLQCPEKNKHTFDPGDARYNGTIYFIYFGLSTTSEKRKEIKF